MNKRKLLGLLCLMTLLATSCDNKGDYWGAMESSKATLTLERICDMATLSQDSVELLSNIPVSYTHLTLPTKLEV